MPLPMSKHILLVLSLSTGLATGCDRKSEPTPPPKPVTTESAPKSYGSLAISKPAPERVVAIGDLHGDLESTRRALRLAGAIDDKDAWVGGKLVVVQTGDAIDRGDDDRTILDLLEKLKAEATKAGGELLAMVGNHEIMNAELDFRYVTKGAFSAFSNVTPKDEGAAQKASALETEQRGRALAFLPGGPYAKMLASRPAVARVGDTIFAHGGVLPKHVKAGLDAINDGARAFLLGEKTSLPKDLSAEDGPLWTRMYSTAPSREDCAQLHEALAMLKAKRMVMGHTVQKPDISPACDDKAWRIDVGLSKFYGGPIEALEIRGDEVKVLKEGPR